MAQIELRGATKLYGTVVAVDAIDLSIADGEFVVLLGPSGCGKSTLLRMVAGLEAISRGEILFDGVLVNDVPTQRRNVAMVFQNYALYPHMRVEENLGFGLRMRGVPVPKIAEKVKSAAAVLGIEQYFGRKPRQLSGGQRQRVAMGRSIVREPVAFLFDEPLSNLDAKLRGQMRVEIKQLQRNLGTTALYVTHDQVEAMTLADRVVVLNRGQIEQIAPPLELYSNPASIFVADFVGTNPMNFFDVTRTDGGVALGKTNFRLDTGLSHSDLRLGIRPENLRIQEDGPLRVETELIEPLGSDTLVHGRLEGQPILLRVDPATRLTIGDVIPVTAAPEHLHLFDVNNGRRVAQVPR